MNIFWNCTIHYATVITHTGTYNSLVEAFTLTLCILNFGWHWGQKLFKKINDNITFISILWSMMLTGLCYSNRLAKITNYENWHTKLIQQSLKEKYMTSSMTAIKAFNFLFLFIFIYFLLLCVFFNQLQSWQMSLVWHVRRIWPPLSHMNHNAVGKDLPYIFNKNT